MELVVVPARLSRLVSRCLAGLLSIMMIAAPIEGQPYGGPGAQSSSSSTATTTQSGKSKSSKTRTKKSAQKKPAPTKKKTTRRATKRRRVVHRESRASRVARTARIRQAFVASTELRPMAQQLATLRSPAAYAGVTRYAEQHAGEAAATAYLALGHAYLLDGRYTEAESSFRKSRQAGKDLEDYAVFLGAEASHDASDDAAAETLLHGFTERFPDSIFTDRAPELEAKVLLAMNNAPGAEQVLQQALKAGLDVAGRSGFQLAQAQVAFALGREAEAEQDFKRVLLDHPLSSAAQTAFDKLTSMGAGAILTTADLRSLGDAYYNAGRYSQAVRQYRTLLGMPGLSSQSRNSFAVAAAACDLKLKRLTRAQALALPDTNDENGARRLYLLMELARDRSDTDQQKSIVTQMESRFPQSRWLAEALFSSGNMYLLRNDFPTAVEYYRYLAAHFPDNRYAAAAHWRAGWLNYRMGNYPEAARIFDEQIRLYSGSTQAVAALYWRGRLYETLSHNPARAAANYRAIVRAYPHYFYALLARQRLSTLGDTQQVAAAQLDRFQPLPAPRLVDTFPAGSPHLAKARLLANAGLNEYIAEEIDADPDSASWGALATAQIFASYGQIFRALRAMKRALPYAASVPIKSIPLAYWQILFPEPWWNTIKAESAKNNLDPYLVASLIRQESEFNPSVVSYANAYGLMQLLPSVGRAMARQEGLRYFRTYQLLDPETNIRLGTRYLRQMLDKFGGVEEYALAAYNAGDYRVADWKADGPYQGMDEFVESIPFTQTREYVQAIMRNMAMYKEIDQFAHGQSRETATAAR